MVKKSSNSLGFTVSVAQQKLFIALAFGSVLIGAGTILYFMTGQYASNSNFSAFWIPMIQALIWPALAFFIPFLLGIRRKMSTINRVFEATFFATLISLAASLVYPVTYAMQGYFTKSMPEIDSYAGFIIAQTSPLVGLGIVYIFAILYYLRKR